MSELDKPEAETRTDGLTTEQLANAGAPAPTAAEPRAFDREPPPADPGRGREAAQPLLTDAEAADLRRSWDSIQAGFVDEPRRAVEQADHLVAQTMQRLAEMFSEERGRLESQWDSGEDVSTEDLRVALQRYRAFFGRLLSV